MQDKSVRKTKSIRSPLYTKKSWLALGAFDIASALLLLLLGTEVFLGYFDDHYIIVLFGAFFLMLKGVGIWVNYYSSLRDRNEDLGL